MRRALDRTGATIRLWYLSAYGLVKSETFVGCTGCVQLFPSRFPWQEQTCGDQETKQHKTVERETATVTLLSKK
jgi:hypothetical protein